MKYQKVGNKRINIHKKILLILLLIVVWTASFGGGLLSYNNPRLNISENPVYEAISLTSMMREYSSDKEAAQKLFDGHCVIFNAYVTGKSSGKVMVTDKPLATNAKVGESEGAHNADAALSADSGKITGSSGETYEITVSVSSGELKSIGIGDYICVYGTLSGGGKAAPYFSIKKGNIKAAPINADRYDYYTYMNEHFIGYSDKDSVSYSLGDSGLTYRIPSTWKNAGIPDEDRAEVFNSKILENAECFVLTPGRASETGSLEESASSSDTDYFVIFYFDKDEFIKYDSEYSADSAIKTAIIRNICPDDSGVWLKNIRNWPVKSDFGREFDYYVSIYKDHRVEFIFTPTDDGFVVMMYITAGKYTYAPDAMYIQRTLDT